MKAEQITDVVTFHGEGPVWHDGWGGLRWVDTSRWIEVPQDQIDHFADVTGDHQWIHVDAERARSGPFGTTIAHGYLLLSLVPVVVEDVMDLRDRTAGVNYGIDRLRFTAPVPSGSRLRGRVTALRGTRRDDGGVLSTLEVVMEREGAERPALVGELLTLSYDG